MVYFTTQVRIGICFIQLVQSLPFIASSEDPQDRHLFILATFVVLSGCCCKVGPAPLRDHLAGATWPPL